MTRVMAVLTALMAFAPALASSELLFASIGSGVYGGGYYSTVRALCDRVNAVERGVMRCSPEATAGSIYNLRALAAGEIDLAIAQSDWSYNAVSGTSVFSGRGMADSLRGVATLYDETLTILATGESGITRAIELVGKHIDIGHPASGRRATVEVALGVFGLNKDAFTVVEELADDASIDALCSGRIDATLMVVGHPSALVWRAIEDCGARLVTFSSSAVEALENEAPYYAGSVIPPGTYPGVTDPILTVGVQALLLARTSLEDALVERVVKELLVATRTGAGLPAVMGRVEPAHLPDIAALMPLHPGAEAAYEAAGLGR